MIELFDDHDDSSTPLTADEKKGLIPTYIRTRGELNKAEQRGIIEASQWAFLRDREVLNVDFLRDLHRRMFKDVWSWAGKFRTTPRNIGIEACDIGPAIRMLIDDTKTQIEYRSYHQDEIAARFHFRLVSIHPFPNGNGRHGRLATDILARHCGIDGFTWGEANLTNSSSVRARYIAALRRAESNHDFSSLMDFMRSSALANLL